MVGFCRISVRLQEWKKCWIGFGFQYICCNVLFGELGFSGKFLLLGIISVRHRKRSDSVFCVLVLDFGRIEFGFS